MKKRIAQIIALALITVLTFSLFACSKQEDPADSTAGASSQAETTEEITAETEPVTEKLTEADQPTTPVEKPAPATTAEIVALYNSAIQKNSTLQAASNSRILEKGEILGSGALEGKSFQLTEDENAKKLIEKNEVNQPMTLQSLANGSVASATCAEQEGKYTLTLNLAPYQGSQPTEETGYAGLINYDACANIAKDIAALFNLKVKVQGADVNLNDGVITAVVDKESGKLLSVSIQYKQSMNVQLKYTIIDVSANIICQNKIELAA